MSTRTEDRRADRTPQSADAQETRKRILDEARQLFRQYGYAKTTVADIAAACSMSPANVYRFFASKAAINDTICEQFLAEDEAALAAIVRLPLSAAERLRRFVLHMNASTLRGIHEKKVNEIIKVALDERWPSVQNHYQRTAELLERLIADGVSRGEFRATDIPRTADCVHLAVSGLRHPVVVAQFMGDPRVPPPADLIDFVLAALTR